MGRRTACAAPNSLRLLPPSSLAMRDGSLAELLAEGTTGSNARTRMDPNSKRLMTVMLGWS
eukprot:CAMPEP_0119117562 /NCGR_PEP_ID=MMETSP1180-20130426/52911_1 /TAXON_ID=3052 ORGANISM="Chlamydomonas cf sp, Strain CCMP681" /NCGR_SAMPLE_ID=MMETSP1180 /ASSEMBLY_ACC=CAM_ASM_000741 /LENGTH=60 /DNA_ID=CAMNT_0007106837 /DNA_START=639 /DNA_END=821 /DNA_ORIENTATION=-